MTAYGANRFRPHTSRPVARHSARLSQPFVVFWSCSTFFIFVM